MTRELLTLPNGAHLIDTPGIRIAGLWDGTGESFADVDDLALQCRFPDCAHDTEPGCAVGDVLDAERIAAWRKLQRELAWVEDRRAAVQARKQFGGRSPGRTGRATRGVSGGGSPPVLHESGRGESNPHLWLGKPTS